METKDLNKLCEELNIDIEISEDEKVLTFKFKNIIIFRCYDSIHQFNYNELKQFLQKKVKNYENIYNW